MYQALGIFLPLITTNCCVLGVAILVIQKDFNLAESIIYAFSTAVGFALALVVFAGLREQLSMVNIPKGMRGMCLSQPVSWHWLLWDSTELTTVLRPC